MDTKTQNIVITVLGLLLIICLWFTFNIFGKKSFHESGEQAIPFEESQREVDLDFTSVDVDLKALREKYGNNLDSVYAAYFPDDEDVDLTKLDKNSSSYAQSTSSQTYNISETIPQYMVIAGAFSTAKNAEIFLDMLGEKGFKDAEVVQFSNSKFISVCVNRTDDLSKARNEVESLKKMNIEAYVHTRKTSKQQ